MEDPNENMEVPGVSKRVESPLEMEMKLSKSDYPSSVHSEVSDEARELDALLNEDDIKLINTGETQLDEQEPVEESMETMLEALQKVESLIGMDIETSNIESAILPPENEEQLDEDLFTEETSETMIPPIEMDIEIPESKDAALIPPESPIFLKEHNRNNEQTELPEELRSLCDSQERSDSIDKMKDRVPNNEEDLATSADMPEESSEVIKTDVMLGLLPEVPKTTKSPTEMLIELTETEVETSLVFDANTKELKEKLQVPEVSNQSESATEIDDKLPKYDDESVIQSEDLDETMDPKEEEKLDGEETVDIALAELEGVTELEETLAGVEEPDEESINITEEMSEAVTNPIEKQEELEDTSSLLEPSKRIDSPVEPDIQLLKEDDISTAQLEKLIVTEEQGEGDDVEFQSEDKIESSCGSPKRIDSPLEIEINPLKIENESVVSLDVHEEADNVDRMEDKLESSSKRSESLVEMEIELAETKDDSIIPVEKSEDSQENSDIFKESIQVDSQLELGIDSTEADNVVQPEIQDEPNYEKQEEEINLTEDAQQASEVSEARINSVETLMDKQEPVDESMETMLEALQKVESLIDIDMETPNTDDAVLSVKTQEQSEEVMCTEETPEPFISPSEMETEPSESRDGPSAQQEIQDLQKEQDGDDEQAELQQALEGLYDSQKSAESPVQMEVRVSDDEDDLAISRDMPEESKEVIPENIKSPTEMYVELSEMENETSLVSDEKTEDPEKKLQVPEVLKQSELSAEMEVELSKNEDESIIQLEGGDKVKAEKEEEKLDNLETVGVDLNENEGRKEETAAEVQEPVEDSMEITQKILKTGAMPIVSVEKEDQAEETNSLPEQSKSIESPVELNIQVSEDENFSAIQLEKQPVTEEQEDNGELQLEEKLKSSFDSPKKTNSPLELFRTEDESNDPVDFHEEANKGDKIEDESESSSESPPRTKSSIAVEIELAKMESENSRIPIEKSEDSQENQDSFDASKQIDSSIEMEIKLPKTDDASIVQSEIQDEPEKQKEEITLTQVTQKSSVVSEEASTEEQEPVEKSIETMLEALKKVESLIDIDMETSGIDDTSMLPIENQEQSEDSRCTQEIPDAVVPSFEIGVQLSERDDVPLLQPEGQDLPEEQAELQEVLEASFNSLEGTDSQVKMESDEEGSKPSNEESLATSTDLSEESKEVTKTEDTLEIPSELTETKVEASVISDENLECLEEKLEVAKVSQWSEFPEEMEVELPGCEEEKLDNQEAVDVDLDADKSLEISPVTKVETPNIEEASEGMQETVEESMETTEESSEETEPAINIKIKLPESNEVTAMPVEKQDESDETKSVLELLQRTESPIESNVKTSKSGDTSIAQLKRHVVTEEHHDNAQLQSIEKLAASCDTPKRTNSPLGMKIKLFKTGDASIVPLDFHEEPKETGKIKDKLESSQSPKRTESPIGMKIKLSKTKGGASIILMDKSEDPRENLDAPDTPKRTDSPLGMRIKLSKTGDASIIQSEIQDENKHAKYKEKVDSIQNTGKGSETSFGMKLRLINSEEESMEEPQEILPKVESPLGMKIRLSKTGDASIIPTEKQEHLEETKSIHEGSRRTESPLQMKMKGSKSGDASEGQSISEEHYKDIHLEAKEKLETYGSPKRTNSPIGMKIKLFKSGDASIVPSSLAEENKEVCKMKDRLVMSSESPKRTESPIGMKIKLTKTKEGASIIPMETSEDSKENLEVPDVSKRTESPLGMKIKLFKSGDASIVHSEVSEEAKDSKQREKSENKGKGESTVLQESSEESMETVPESWQKVESPIGMKIKLSKFGDASIITTDKQEHLEETKSVQDVPKRTDSPLGMKIRLSKTGDASIIQPEWSDHLEEYNKDHTQPKPKEKLDSSYDSPKRTGSPLGMKIKLLRTGDASIVSSDLSEESKAMSKFKDKLESSPEVPKRTESPIGMKIKLAKTKSGAAIIPIEIPEDSKEKLEITDTPKRTESPLGMKIKLFKSGDASIVHSEIAEETKDMKQKEKAENREKIDVTQDGGKSSEMSGIKIKVIKSGDTSVVSQESMDELIETTSESWQKVESLIGMKIKLSKLGDASIIPAEKEEQSEEFKLIQDASKRTESPLGMKIKLSKSGDASIIQSEAVEDGNKLMRTDTEHSKPVDTSLGMKIKLLKTGDASIVDSEKKERQQRRQDIESPLEMKIKLSKTGHPTIVAYDNQGESTYKQKEALDLSQNFTQRYKESGQSVGHKEPALKILKTGHSTILQSNRSELTIEPIQTQGKKADSMLDISPNKRKDISISPIESKKPKLEAQLTQILPEVTIQPVASKEQKQFVFDPKSSAISLQQMNVISQEISITQVRPSKPADATMSEKLKDILSNKNVSGSPMNSDCEIIEHRPELIIVNENSNSSQDVVIIEEVSPTRMPEVKVPKKRGRPRRNPLPQGVTHPPPQLLMTRDPLSLDDMHKMQQSQLPHFESRENERPKRTCRSQKSYAPPKRGRGRGRGKRKLDNVDLQLSKKVRIDQDLTTIEASTTAVITIDDSVSQSESFGKSPELYKALKQPTLDSKANLSKVKMVPKSDGIKGAHELSEINKESENKKLTEIVPDKVQKSGVKSGTEEGTKLENRDILIPPGHPNWLTPVSKRASENATKHENMSTVQVIDEETRMSAESGSRSQTPARNIPVQASETIINEESQGSVLSTATTESEKVKVKNRRMEINFDPDEGPFTVDKIAEYEWPLDRKGETFMIQEQISQYLGVKSFKRKYPDLKRRVVDMEERNYLRENGLVSEAMCDMGLTAVCSSEVLDVMCSDFPDQYEEYRKHMREKQVKEHSKKQKELTAAATAEKNRIDLAEMAVQSALSWNISLNKARREDRKCSLDLQTFTIHVPKKQQKVEERKVGYYPVALIPGQYTDYYREYTPAELRYYPLNTVLYGPTRPNERKFDSQSEGSQSDNDSDSSSDDSSEGTQNTEGSQSTMDDVDMEIAHQKEEIKLKCKMCLKTLNKQSKNEVLIQCGTCNGHVHPSCIDLTLDMVPHIQSYAWQCTDCKTCAQCHDPADEDKMLFCDMCDRGYHIYCVGLRRVPQGRWHCQECAVCANCASREPGGINSDRNSVAQWQHEYKKGDKNTRVYVSTLCVPCSKLWRKGRYCPHCSRCHTAPRLDLEANLVHCSACDKYLHLDCVETKGVVLDRKNYLCDFCTPTRQHMIKPLISKTLRT
ncbi:titin isoform X2 [Osmia bicornis bicornis]|uniref:titin isoform X2 n=1 Tax=Osmia bicornis bicornis TaxID=1437191 RepID=UPI001EAF2B32|nr:titin isoform X2 [Osmia bicornis bicornis]